MAEEKDWKLDMDPLLWNCVQCSLLIHLKYRIFSPHVFFNPLQRVLPTQV